MLFLKPTSTKQSKCCNGASLGDHCVLEGDRITPSKSHGQLLLAYYKHLKETSNRARFYRLLRRPRSQSAS